MIRTDKLHQWAPTQMAVHDAEPHNRARWRYEPSISTEEEIESAHAAIDWDDDPGVKMTLPQAFVWWWPAISPALGLVLLWLVPVYWSEIAAFLGVA